jgi:PAS domain S-box-containing protein
MKVAPRCAYDVRETTAALLDRALVTAFLENVPDLVYFKDRASRFLAVSRSKARRHQLTPETMLGKSDADFFSAGHVARARLDEENIIRTGTPVIGKLERLTWPDGRQSWAVTTKMPLRDEHGEVIGTFGLSKDVTAAKQMEADLEKAHKDLVAASRVAGMAEVATGVLHNVGNVLTSLNVSASILATGLRESKAGSLVKLSALLQEHAHDLGEFLTHDPKGRRVPEFLDSLAAHSLAERDRLLAELAAMQQHIDHIKEIVSMQQACATMVGVIEPLDPTALLEEALRMNASALVRHDVSVIREFGPAPHVVAEKAKVLQILVNLIRNAKYACDDGGHAEKILTLRIAANAGGRVRLAVQDNGVGIPAENLPRLFGRGFTTRKTGHGFGLHSSANAAKEMHGTLSVASDGAGCGATFTLELPAAPAETFATSGTAPVT